jgi:hypothetical protein
MIVPNDDPLRAVGGAALALLALDADAAAAGDFAGSAFFVSAATLAAAPATRSAAAR